MSSGNFILCWLEGVTIIEETNKKSQHIKRYQSKPTIKAYNIRGFVWEFN